MADSTTPAAAATAQYKLRGFKIASSNQALANQEIRYRSVFDEAELSYLYAELALFNKRFDEDDWSLSYEIKIFDQLGTLIGSIPKTINVSKDTNILYVREGWGTASGGYFRKGTYRFEAWIEGAKLAEATATVLTESFDDPNKNPYFEIQSLRLFEGGYDQVPVAQRRYLSQVDSKTARYVWVELVAKHLRKKDDTWPCQLVFNFFFDTGELKGQTESFTQVAPSDETITALGGWGSPQPTWSADNYRLEVVFMDRLIAVLPFTSGTGEVVAPDAVTWTPEQRGATSTSPPSQVESLETLMAQLSALIGLDAVKLRVQETTQYLKFVKVRQDKGLSESAKIDLNAVFTGSPGTGKTTVARLLGKLYHRLGMLSRGHIVEVDRADLIGRYIGHTAPLVKEAIAKARGGVLFIDEAYALARSVDDAKDFGHEAIEILLREMSEGPGDLAVFVAGYAAPMQTFLASNPGLRSRFVTQFEFPDYQPDELLLIADRVAQKRGVSFSPAAREVVERALTAAFRTRDDSFGNARFVTGLVDEAKLGLGVRVAAQGDLDRLSARALSTIEAVDVERVLVPRGQRTVEIPVQETALQAVMAELRALVGLGAMKSEIDDLVKLVRFYRDTGKSLHKTFALHAVLTGNPGTGKTTLARLLARLYHALGLLERGHLVECDRQGMVASFVGQTAPKTAKLMDQARGGMLFIDEAYALTPGTPNDFGPEAIETLLKRMEDQRGEIAVIVAGYPAQMQTFLSANPGLRSRFDRTFHLPDYTPIELYEITLAMLKTEALTPDIEAARHLLMHWQTHGAQRGAGFANAREVRKLVDVVAKKQHLRLSALPKAERTAAALAALTLADVSGFAVAGPPPDAGVIGFRALK